MIIWGTGNVCNHLLQSNPDLKPEFFIDNCFEKTNSMIYNKRIVHPSMITEWKGLYIIVAVDAYVPIKEQLEEEGLKEGKDFLWYRDYLFQKSLDELEEEAKCFCVFLKEQKETYKGKRILISDFLAFDKGVCNYVNEWYERGLDAVLLSEAYWISDFYAKEKMRIPVCKLPAVLAHNQYLKVDEAVEKELIEYVYQNRYLTEASQNLRMGYPKMATNYEYVICYWADKIVNMLLDNWQPKEVILWNAFYAFHYIVRNICEEKDIPVKYMEFGNIPGTIQVENLGQMGESYPARHVQEFLDIPVSEAEYSKAESLIGRLYKNRTNRNEQPRNTLLETVKDKLEKDKLVILYAGQNDNAAGLQPYTVKSKQFHSPIFKSSDEAAIYLAELCRKNSWNFIYKPHPMAVDSLQKETLPDNAIVVNNVDINEVIDLSDVVVTILSTVSYVALIRNKPPVMLGYTQLKCKGCCYEAFVLDEIENTIKQAINRETIEEKKESFIKHIVQMQKYYRLVEE